MRQRQQQRKMLLGLTVLVCAMFAFGFALVPIYNRLCSSFGINGKISLEASPKVTKHAQVSSGREVVVEFIATNNNSMPWRFFPEVKKIKIHPGEMAKLAFYAENTTDHRMTVQAIPSVSPGVAAKYIKKTECFCFTQQTLNGHEAMDMPLLFHLDPALPEGINTVTLAYTLFDVSNRVID
jgi:cytochrome c oxidase assembly protein subunit 11